MIKYFNPQVNFKKGGFKMAEESSPCEGCNGDCSTCGGK